MTTPQGSLCARLASLSMLALAACSLGEPRTTITETVRLLTDADGDGLMSSEECQPSVQPFCGTIPPDGEPLPEEPGCIVIPNPGGCAAVEWTQTAITTVDPAGNLISQIYTVCEQCLDAAGDPVGPEICSEEGGAPPLSCYPIPSFTGSCWECVTADGQIYAECVEDPLFCWSDEECPEGTICQLQPFECPPNADCAQVMAGSCVVPDPNIYCTSDEECPSGMVCEGGEILPCDPTVDFCPMMAFPIQAGICVEPVVYCTSDADCGPGQACELFPAPCDPNGTDCAPIAPSGVCVDVQVDPCAGHFDEGSCSADAANGCGWISFLDTPEDVVCAAIGCDGVCVQLYEPGDRCTIDADCDPGQICEYQPLPPACDPDSGICLMYAPIEGLCVTPEEPAPGCSSDAECAPGQICQLEPAECPPNAVCIEVMVGSCVEAPGCD